MLMNRRITHAICFSALLIAPALLADCGSDALSLGQNGGSSNAGSSGVGGGSSGGSGGGSAVMCAKTDCGPQLGIANYQCPDGSTAGPTGRCLKRDNGTCGWEILSCPVGGGGSGGASAGAGGQASGGTSSGSCGGHICTADQVC